VPPAAQLAFSATRGPRVLPGVYTVRLTKGSDVLTTTIEVALDRRADFSAQDREAQLAAMLRVRDLFGGMSDMVMQINAVRMSADKYAAAIKGEDALKTQLAALSAKADRLRGKIVATKEGGAITGEERLREHTDQLYGAITSWEGPPSQYQLDNIVALRAQLVDIDAAFSHLAKTDLPSLNKTLHEGGMKPLEIPAAAAFDIKDEPGGAATAGGAANRSDADMRGSVELPKNLRLWN
jgi:hypothetical protein